MQCCFTGKLSLLLPLTRMMLTMTTLYTITCVHDLNYINLQSRSIMLLLKTTF